MPIGRKPFRVELYSPQWTARPAECTFAVLPAWDGQVGILAGRAPLVCKLGPGELALELSGRWVCYFLDGGFATMRGNVLTILADRAVPAEEMLDETARAPLVEAGAVEGGDDRAEQVRLRQIARARAQRAIARSQHQTE